VNAGDRGSRTSLASSTVAGGSTGKAPTRITWLGHSTVAIDTGGVQLLTDPVLRRRIGHLRRAEPVGAIPSPDAVLVSHVHWDHLDLPSLRLVGLEKPIVVPHGSEGLLLRHGFRRVTGVAPGSWVEFRGVRVLATHAEHRARRRPWGSRPPSLGFLIDGWSRVYFAGDTDLFAEMGDIAPVDVALLPIAGWGRMAGPGHLDPLRAAEAVRRLRPRFVVPIHWGTYSPAARARGKRVDNHSALEEFVGFAGELSPGTRVVALRPGETTELGP
jgi:L-ascorbate metabolism protein UlaG (beta-lactamase superfamily)